MNREDQLESRIIELETKLAFQDDLLNDLNDVVAEQSQTVSVLTRELYELQQVVNRRAPPNTAAQSEETPPPHY